MIRFLWGFAIGVAITLLVTGYYAWIMIGAIPLVGRMAQGIIKRKAKKAIGIEKSKPKKTFRPGGH